LKYLARVAGVKGPSSPPATGSPKAVRTASRRTTAPGNAGKVTDPVHRLSTEDIVEKLGDKVTALRDAQPEPKPDVYRNLGAPAYLYPAHANGAGLGRSIDLEQHPLRN